MPTLATLIDNFNDDIIGADWGNSYGGASETGGRARVPCVAGVYAGYQTAKTWRLAGSSVYLKAPTVPAASTAAEAQAVFSVINVTDGTNISFNINTVAGTMRLESNVAYWDAGATVLTYSATDHLWMRLREDGTNLYWDTSPDGSTWTNRRTLTTPAWITDAATIDTCALDLWSYRDAGTTDYAEYDNVNTLSDGAVWNASAALTADTTLAATAQLAASATATLAADSELAATAALSAHASAALAAQSDLTADFADGSSLPEEVAGLAAGDWDLVIEQGATFSQIFNCTVDDPAFTWAGFTARAQIRSEASAAGDLLLDLTDYLTISGGAIHLDIPASITATLTRNGRWDLEMVQGSGVVRLLQGKAIVSPEVTR